MNRTVLKFAVIIFSQILRILTKFWVKVQRVFCTPMALKDDVNCNLQSHQKLA